MTIPYYAGKSKHSNVGYPEDYYDHEDLELSVPKDTIQQETAHDLIMSDYDIR